jgi:hypothetical protein
MTAGRTRLAAAVALVAAALLAALLVAGGAEGDEAAVGWKDVQVFDSGVATDRILAGKITNTSLRELELDVEDVRVFDGQGGEVRSAVRYREAFAHGIFPWSQKPDDVGDFERRRLGEVLTLKPGQEAPITLSWRVPPGGEQPVKVDLGPAELALPSAAGRSAPKP